MFLVNFIAPAPDIHPVGFLNQFILKTGMSNFNHFLSPLPGGFAFDIGDAVFGYYIMGDRPGDGYDRSRTKGGSNPGTEFALPVGEG